MNKKSIAITVAAGIISSMPTIANAVAPSSSVPVSQKASNNCCHTAKTKQKSMNTSATKQNTKPKEQNQ